MGLIDKIKSVFRRKPKDVPLPPPPVVKGDILAEYRAKKAAEMTAEIDRLRGLEKAAVSDSLRGKYRAAREAVEAERSRI